MVTWQSLAMPRTKSAKPGRTKSAALKLTHVREFSHARGQNHIDYYAYPAGTFKSVTMRATFTLPLVKDTAAQHAIIPSLLRRATRNHPSLAAIAQRCEELYGTSIKALATRVGQQQLLSITMRVPGPELVPNGRRVFSDAVGLARELVADPLIRGDGFDKDIFASEQEQLAQAIRAIVDDKQGYAMRRALETSFPDHPYGVAEYGTEEAVKALTREGTLRAFEALRANAKLDVYLSGPFDLQRDLPVVMAAFSGIDRNKPGQPPTNEPAKAPAKLRSGRDKQKMEQSFAVLTYATGVNIASPHFAALRFADALFGRLSTSRLFQVVREKHGLAYSVGSYADDATGMGVSYAGTDPKHQDKAIALMRSELERLKREVVTDAEFAAARNSLIDAHLAERDSPGARIASLIIQRSCGTLATQAHELAALKAVTPSKVRDVFKRYKPIAEYRLGPK